MQGDPALRHFCANPHTYVRYLRARGWNLARATKMLRATLAWRAEFKPHLIRFDDVKEEFRTGMVTLYPHPADHQGRPLLVMRPRCGPSARARPVRFSRHVADGARWHASTR
jgi:hypothetical protein